MDRPQGPAGGADPDPPRPAEPDPPRDPDAPVEPDPSRTPDARVDADPPRSPDERAEHVYDLFRRGTALLEARDFAAAAIPLEQARSLEPDKTSIREALGRAYFHAGRYADAREEFAAVVERSPVNDFAHFCLGRALEKIGRRAEARRHLTLAASLRPDRADYRAYRNRIAAA